MHIARCDLFRSIMASGTLSGEDIVDAHGHFNFYDERPLRDEVSEVLQEMDRCGIVQSLVFHCGDRDYRNLNDIILQGCGIAPERFIPFAFITMKKGPREAIAELERCRKAGMRGLKLHASFDCIPFVSSEFRSVWEFCRSWHWPVIVHGISPELPAANPEVTFIGAHTIEYVQNRERLLAFAASPNFHFCTSATFCQMGAVAGLVKAVGSERVIFGSDYTLNSITIRLGEILCSRISLADARLILGGNIRRLLGNEMD